MKTKDKNLPKPKNILTYAYFCFMKVFFIVFFGVGAMFLAICVFPWIRLFVHPKDKFQAAARSFVSGTFRFFINFMKVTGIVRMVVHNQEEIKNMKSKVIVANHPSLLDFVFIMSFVPNATCIVNHNLLKTPLAGVIKQAYIINTLNFDELCHLCKNVIDSGSNVIIFPEGTRSPRQGSNAYKKGAARIALFAKCGVMPFFIAGSDKYGLGKNEPLFSYNPTERYLYEFFPLDEIKASDYAGEEEPIAAKHLTQEMHERIYKKAEEYKNDHPLCKTLNNL